MKDTGSEQLLRNNRRISIQAEQYANGLLAKQGVTAVQANVLQFVLRQADEHGTSLTRVQREFGYSKASLSHILKALRRKGYVRTENCADDGRAKLIFPTEAGEQLRGYLENTFSDMHHQLYGAFSTVELEALDEMQKKLLRNLSELTKQSQKEASEF